MRTQAPIAGSSRVWAKLTWQLQQRVACATIDRMLGSCAPAARAQLVVRRT
jgi:hypothetical protein